MSAADNERRTSAGQGQLIPSSQIKLVHLGELEDGEVKDEVEDKKEENALKFSSEWSAEPDPRFTCQRTKHPESARISAIKYGVFNLSDDDDKKLLEEIELASSRTGRYHILGQVERKFVQQPKPTFFALVHYEVFEFKRIEKP